MWIFDLGLAFLATVTAMIIGLIAYKKHYKAIHPPPTLDDKIRFFEEINEKLRREMEG